jgi:hypothetical protein
MLDKPTPVIKLTKASHYFKISSFAPYVIPIIQQFMQRLIQKGLTKNIGRKGFHYGPIKVFASSNQGRTEYRLNINLFDSFIEHLTNSGVNKTHINVEQLPIPVGEKMPIQLKPMWIAKDYQIPLIEQMSDEQDPYHSRFLHLQTGRGKTFIALTALSKNFKRTIIVIKPGYIYKWVEDITKTFYLEPKDIMVIEGGPSLRKFLKLATEGAITQHFIIMSNRTLAVWFKNYEKFGSNTLKDYCILPEDMYETVGAGRRLIDELHQDFHLNVKQDHYTNVERSFELTATLLSDDPFMKKMYEIPYPGIKQIKPDKLVKYINAYSFLYDLNKDTVVNTEEYGKESYSHMAFERSILRNKRLLENYMSIIHQACNLVYFRDYKDGNKMVVFASSIEMCTVIRNYLRSKYKDLTIERYAEDDPVENLIDSDIRVTTIGSGGTAHDISNLTATVLTISLDSIKSNIQILGRLRQIPGKQTRLAYLACNSIAKHMTYHEKKIALLNERAATLNNVYCNTKL